MTRAVDRIRNAAGLAMGVVLMAFAAAPITAQATAQRPQDRARADVCCAITAIDARAGTVTGKVTATNATFTVQVKDAAFLRTLKIGEPLSFEPAPPPNCTGNAASSSTNCGSNVPRGADTRPKECIATNSAGQQIKVACPDNVPIKVVK